MTDSDDFWQWALAVYQDPQLQELLLSAQNDHQLTVLELLLCAWLAARGRDYGDAERCCVRSICDVWEQEVVVPLRATRRHWKGDPERQAMRVRLQALELDAERCLAELMVSALPDQPQSAPRSAEPNLSTLVQLRPEAEELLLALAAIFDARLPSQ